MRSIFAVLTATMFLAAPAAAQDSPFFVNVNFGFQAQSQDFTQSAEFPLYEETGSWAARHSINGGPFFDLGGGMRVPRGPRNLSVGAAYTARFKHTRNVTVDVNAPSPIFTDTFRTASGIASDLEHSEQALHLQALWLVPVTVEFEVTVFGGPSFFSVRDELVESVVPSETGGDFSTVDVGFSTSGQRNSTAGFNIGVDTRYMLMQKFGFIRDLGVGAMLRYSRGSIDLTPIDNGSGGVTIDAGGLEIGAGLRFRF